MSWDERLFGALFRAARGLRAAGPGPEAVALEEVHDRLRVLACALAGRAVELRQAEGVGGPRAGALWLPARMDGLGTAEEHALAYVLRVAYDLTSARLGLRLPQEPAGLLPGEWRALCAALAAPQVCAAMVAEWPGAAALLSRLSDAALARRPDAAALTRRAAALEALLQRGLRAEGRADPGADIEGLARAAAAQLRLLPGRALPPPLPLWGEPESPVAGAAPIPCRRGETAEAAALPGGTERRGRPREEVRRVQLREDREADNPLVHVFEKVHTAEEYRGGRKTVDGRDEMAEHGEALDELELREVIRTRTPTRSLYRADIPALDSAFEAGEAEPALPGLRYDEWDEGRRAYLREHCTLHVEPPPRRLDDGAAAARVAEVLRRWDRQVRGLRAEFERVAKERAWRGGSADGPEVDIDAVVDRHGSLRAGHAPPERLYLQRRSRGRDLATLLLLDCSLSTDGWVGGRRVLDVARESVIVLGEVLASLPGGAGQVGIGAFYSNTRKDCRYVQIKDFAEPWAGSQRRLAQVEPRGYTRIGPALRHGLRLLRQTPARRRLLLLISDGKPTDYDRYEGRHGIGDVRQALREAAQAQVQSFALAVDAQARNYLPLLFGHGRYEILPEPGRLVTSLARVYSELLR